MMTQKMSERIRPFVVVAAVAVVAIGSAQARRYMTPGFRTADTRPMHVAVLPPHAEFVKQKVVMTEEMIKECEALEDAAADQIPSILEGKGYKVRRVTLEEIDADPDLKEMVLRVNERYNEEWVRIVRRPKRTHDGRYSAGDGARQLAAMLEVDGIVLPRIQAVAVSGGKKALTAILSLGSYMAQGYARMDLSIVNGSTGGVEAYFFSIRAAGTKALTKKADKLMAKVAGKALKKYPESDEVLQPRGEVGELDADEGDKDEEAVLGELEALLGPSEEDEDPPADEGDSGG